MNIICQPVKALPLMKQAEEMIARMNSASTSRSLSRAPMDRPVGPPEVQPQAQIKREMVMPSPTEAAGMGKYSPAINRKTRQLAIHSTQFMCALWPLLSSYHCWQVRFLEQKPLPVSGQPPALISLPVDFRCSAPKFCFMYSSVNTLPRARPANRNPTTRIENPMTQALRSTYPYQSGKLTIKVIGQDILIFLKLSGIILITNRMSQRLSLPLFQIIEFGFIKNPSSEKVSQGTTQNQKSITNEQDQASELVE